MTVSRGILKLSFIHLDLTVEKILFKRCIKIDTNVQLCYNEIEDFLLIRNAYLFGKQTSGLETYFILYSIQQGYSETSVKNNIVILQGIASNFKVHVF